MEIIMLRNHLTMTTKTRMGTTRKTTTTTTTTTATRKTGNDDDDGDKYAFLQLGTKCLRIKNFLKKQPPRCKRIPATASMLPPGHAIGFRNRFGVLMRKASCSFHKISNCSPNLVCAVGSPTPGIWSFPSRPSGPGRSRVARYRGDMMLCLGRRRWILCWQLLCHGLQCTLEG